MALKNTAARAAATGWSWSIHAGAAPTRNEAPNAPAAIQKFLLSVSRSNTAAEGIWRGFKVARTCAVAGLGPRRSPGQAGSHQGREAVSTLPREESERFLQRSLERRLGQAQLSDRAPRVGRQA